MLNKKIFLSFLLFSVLNVFSIKPVNNNYELKLACNTFSTMQVHSSFNQIPSTRKNNIITYATTNIPKFNKYLQPRSLPINITEDIIQAMYFPELQSIATEYKKRNVNCQNLEQQMDSLAVKYKCLILQNPNTIELFSCLNTNDLSKRIYSLIQKKQTLTNYIKNCHPKMHGEIYKNAHKPEKQTVLNSLLTERKKCANAIANLSITDEKIRSANASLNEKNASNLQKAEELYNGIIKKNISHDTTSYQAMALERAQIARKICTQKYSEQHKDRTFNLSGISSEFLKNNSYNQEEISKLSGANDLQDFLQKDFIDHIKENQSFKQEHGNTKILLSLSDLHTKCIKNGLQANKAGDTKRAMAYSDLCWRTAKHIKTFAKALENFGDIALETIHALDTASYEAVKTFLNACDILIQDFFKRPDEHITYLAEGALDGTADFAITAGNALDAVICNPIQTIKKSFIAACTLSSKAAEINTKCIIFCVESIDNPVAAKENIRALKDNVCQFIANAGDSLSEANKLEITHAIGEFVASGYLTGEALKFAGTFVKIVGSEISEGFGKALKEIKCSKVPIPAVATTDGLIMPMEGLKETAQGSAQLINNLDRVSELKKYIGEMPGFTIKDSGKIIIDVETASLKYAYRLTKLGLNPKISIYTFSHIIDRHYQFGANYSFNFINKLGKPVSTFLADTNFIELALTAIESGTKIDATTFIYDFGKVIGLNDMGIPTTKIQVALMDSLNAIKTAYPI